MPVAFSTSAALSFTNGGNRASSRAGAAPGFSKRYVNQLKLPQLLSQPSYRRPEKVDMESRISPWKCGFPGIFLITPVSLKLYLPSRRSDWPMGLAVPKYFCAPASLSTAEKGSLSALVGSPFNNG